jgi:hypothetical protein
MARVKKESKEKPIEVTLWDVANKLRGIRILKLILKC